MYLSNRNYLSVSKKGGVQCLFLWEHDDSPMGYLTIRGLGWKTAQLCNIL